MERRLELRLGCGRQEERGWEPEDSWDGAQTAPDIPSLSFSSLPSRISPGFLEAA